MASEGAAAAPAGGGTLPVTINTLTVAPAGVGAVPDFEPGTRDVSELAPGDVLVKVLACGVCATDMYMMGSKGAVPGHEVVGIVEAVGPAVDSVSVGQRVGAGYATGSCGSCRECVEDYPMLCKDFKNYFSAPNGGFASHVTYDALFVCPIPDALPSPLAAPLLCAGATVFSAIKDSGIRVGGVVGVLGIGGLGHLALQFARAMGYTAVALTRSADKAAHATEMGASSVLVTTDEDAMKAAARSLDLLLSTVPGGDVEWKPYFKLLQPRGGISFVGVPARELTVPGPPLVMQMLSVRGSLVCGPARMHSMLTLATEKGIKPVIEVSPMTPEGAKKAVESVATNTVRFRAVLVADGCDGVV